MTQLTRLQNQTIKRAARDQVRASGGVDAAARCSRPGMSQLSNYGNNQNDQHMPADVIADLTQESGEPFVLRALAEMTGFDLVPIEPETADLLELVSALARRNVAATKHQNIANAAFADGKLTISEARDYYDASLERKQANDAGHDRITKLLADLEARQAKGEHRPSIKVVKNP